MERSEVVNVLEREVAFTSEDHLFSVKVNFSRTNFLEIHTLGLADPKRFEEVFNKAADFFLQTYSIPADSSLIVLVNLYNFEKSASLGQSVSATIGQRFPFPKKVLVAFVCSNFFKRIYWKIWLKGKFKVPFAFFKSEEEFKQFVQGKEKIHRKKVEDPLLNEFFKEEVVHYKNNTFYVTSRPEWEYATESGSFRYLLINKEVILIQMKGRINEEMIDESVRINKEIVKGMEGEKFVNLLELTDVVYPGWKVRKYAMMKGDETEYLWKHRIMLVNPLMAISYNTLKIAFPKYAENTKLVAGFSAALDEYINYKNKGLFTGESKKLEGGDKKLKSRKELEARIEELERNQDIRTRQLFEIFSKISWDDTYKPVQIDIDYEDPFYSLFYAVNYFQKDIYEIIKIQKELALNLEEKVKERTEELYEKNQDLQKVNHELVKVNKELDHFVYSVSHDLRAPIASMKGLVNLLQLEGNPEATKLYSNLISKNLCRLDFFIVEILELSRNSRLPVAKENINFKEIIQSVFEELEHLGNASRIKKRMKVQGDSNFLSDKHRIVIIFRNILSNAIKYSMPQFKQSFIQIEVILNDKGVHIMVADNGIGIEKDYLPNIFDMFFRATDQQAGSGLGLYIVKEMVEKLNGNIEVRSEHGEGTTFILNLPNLGGNE